MAEIKVEIKDTGDLKRLSRDLGRTAEGKELRKELGRAFRAIMRPILVEVKALYSGVTPSRRPIRPALKRVTRMEVRLTGRFPASGILVDGRRMPEGLRKMPQYWEGEAVWRSPVFGHRDRWYTHTPHPGFYRIASGHDLSAEREIAEAEHQSLRPLERG